MPQEILGSMVHPRRLSLYGMINSFFGTARDVLDPIVTALDGYQTLATDVKGRPAPPVDVAKRLAELEPHEQFDHIGASFVATTNLGYAYVYAFKLVHLLETDQNCPAVTTSAPHLAELYDALPGSAQQALRDVYSGISSHDLTVELSPKSLRRKSTNGDASGPIDLRQQLQLWQSRAMLHESHRKLAEATDSSPISVFIPLGAMFLLDEILAKVIAPKLGLDYKTMDREMSSGGGSPALEWDGTSVSVSLPDKRGRTIHASWDPAATSVIRIRESGTQEWSPGFETPLNKCTFVGLKPDTVYDVQLTHKNAAGESEPALTTVKTKA